jgi:ribonuclease Z
VASRELVILGTASQSPTRYRHHNGYLLRWDGEGILFDPGEGTQRQMLLAGIPASAITRICITHFHGDHCLGLPGVLQRLSLDRVDHPVDVYFPASGFHYFERLRWASVYNERTPLRLHPVTESGPVAASPPFTLTARFLDHRIDTLGWRLTEPDGYTMVPAALAAFGIEGANIARLQETGRLERQNRTVTLADVSRPRPGQQFALVMDTRWCAAALELARGVDLLVCESTFLARDEALAWEYGHLTANQAATVARDAGVTHLVLTHFSQRYQDEEEFRAEARAVFDNVDVARDFMRVALPRRRPQRFI